MTTAQEISPQCSETPSSMKQIPLHAWPISARRFDAGGLVTGDKSQPVEIAWFPEGAIRSTDGFLVRNECFVAPPTIAGQVHGCRVPAPATCTFSATGPLDGTESDEQSPGRCRSEPRMARPRWLLRGGRRAKRLPVPMSSEGRSSIFRRSRLRRRYLIPDQPRLRGGSHREQNVGIRIFSGSCNRSGLRVPSGAGSMAQTRPSPLRQ